MSEFLGRPQLELVEDTTKGLWRLLQPFSYQSDVAGTTIVVPAGFPTDFCSVPRVPLAWEFLGDRARRAGIVHDWLYTCKMFPREMADRVLKEMVLVCGLDELEATAFYLAVHVGGASHWNPIVAQGTQPDGDVGDVGGA